MKKTFYQSFENVAELAIRLNDLKAEKKIIKKRIKKLEKGFIYQQRKQMILL